MKMDDVLKSYANTKLLFISPPYELWGHLMGKVKEVSCRVRILTGEFSNVYLQEVNDNVVIVSGANRYVSRWAEYMFD